jgi:hypothetical protein
MILARCRSPSQAALSASEDTRWFASDRLISRADDISFRLASSRLDLPPAGRGPAARPAALDSIARRLIEDWLHGRIEVGSGR